MARGGITVLDIVGRISLPINFESLVEQLRYWTDEGLFVPMPGTGRGTGNYRSYSEEMIWRAKLLKTMAGNGAKIEQMRLVIEKLDNLDNDERMLWQLAKDAQDDCGVYLVMPPLSKPRIFRGLEPLQ